MVGLIFTRNVRPTCVRLRAQPSVDGYGDPSLSWDAPEELALPRYLIKHGLAEDDRTRATSEVTLLLPGAADILYQDRVRIGDVVWQVDGRPEVHLDRLGRARYTSADLKLVSG